MANRSQLLLLAVALLTGCGAAVEPAEQFAPCEAQTKRLANNVNGCWRITARTGFHEQSYFMCSAEPTCEVIPGDEQDYVSGDAAWVGDVRCDAECAP